MENIDRDSLLIQSEGDIVSARKQARELAKSQGFDITDITRIVTAVSELVRNIFHYAGEGRFSWRIVSEGRRKGVEFIFEDHGPGITNIEAALCEGYSTSGGLGLGLPGAKKLMDEMTIQSEPGKGTMIMVKKWKM